MKTLNSFEVTCLVRMLAQDMKASRDTTMMTAAEGRRLRSRLSRFVLSHPLVTTAIARVFKVESKGRAWHDPESPDYDPIALPPELI